VGVNTGPSALCVEIYHRFWPLKAPASATWMEPGTFNTEIGGLPSLAAKRGVTEGATDRPACRVAV